MAKKKVDEREQARQERVSETVSKTDQFFRENKKTIYGILIALLIIGLAIVGYYKLIYQPKAKEAARQMYPAEANFRSGEFDLALNGDGNVLGFSQIIDDFGAKGGRDVYFYAGLCEYNLGNYQQAIDYLKKYKSDEAITKARAQAIAVDDNFSNIFNATYMLKAGVVCEQLGDNAKALSYYKAIKDKYPQSMEGYDIDKYISRIESQQ